MPNNNYEILKYRPEFKYEVADIEKYLWGSNIELNVKYLEWKYEQNPYKLYHSLYLSLYDGKVVGATGYSWGMWQIGKPPLNLLVPCNADASIDPDHRRRGLLTKMNKLSLEDFKKSDLEYSYTLSANPNSTAANLKLGWFSRGNIEIGYRLPIPEQMVNDSNLISRYSKKIVNRLQTGFRANSLSTEQEADPLILVDTKYRKNEGKYDKYIFIAMSPKSDEMTALVDLIGYDGRLRHIRDQQFFDWRFKNPSSRYRFLFLARDSNLDGYLILRASTDLSRKAITIVDLEAVDHQTRNELLKAAVDLCRNSLLIIWTDSLSPESRSALEQLGFTFSTESSDDMPTHPNILIYAIRQGSTNTPFVFSGLNLLDRKNWDLRAIYSDSY
jgi:hypothetical protein